MNYQTAIQQKKVEISRSHSDLCGKIDIINKDIIKDISSIRDEIIDRLDVISCLSSSYELPNEPDAQFSY